MQRTELIRRVVHVDEVVHRALDACEHKQNVPRSVRESISALGEHTNQVRQQLLTEADPVRVIESIDELEALGDRAKRVCEQSGVGGDGLARAVLQAHSELSNLKHQLH